MSEPVRYAPRVRPSLVAVCVLVVLLLAVPAAIFAAGGRGPWSDPSAAPAPTQPPSDPGVPGSSPSASATSAPTPGATAPGARVVRGTTLRREPRVEAATPDDALTRALRREAEALLREEAGLPTTPAPPEVEPEVAPESAVPVEPVVAAASFRVSSFNILGAAHTARGGTRPQFAAGPTRMRWAMSLLRSAGVSVAGLQELEPPQHATFQQVAPAWDVYPGMKLQRSALANSVVWDTATWQFVDGHTIQIPYFHGRPRPMPYVLLRHRASGREVWFANFHNPASVRGPAARWRREAVARETALANRLSATRTPVIMTGDMNDRAEFFCPMTTRTRLHAANGGSRGGPCSPPPNMGIDWIMGSPEVAFEGHRADRGGLVARTSDHPFVWTSATIGG